MKNTIKKGLVITNIIICLMLQSISALAWMDAEVINDYSDDLKMFDEEFYGKYEIEVDDDPNSDLDTMHEALSKHWYNDEKATVLTEKKNEDYAYIDILDISKEVVSEELVIKIRTRGDLSKEDYWICFVWNDDMLLMFVKISSNYGLIDLDNEEVYEGEFYDTDDQFITRFEDIAEDAWEGSDIKFISIGMNSDDDIIVDITPNPTNWTIIYIYTGIIVVSLGLFVIAVYYKNKN